jgi:hypothetical protein
MGKSTGRTHRRSHGEGSIYETGDGRVRGAVQLAHPTTGLRVRRVVSGRTRSEVVRKLEALRRDAAAGALSNGQTVAEYLSQWLTTGRDQIRPRASGSESSGSGSTSSRPSGTSRSRD